MKSIFSSFLFVSLIVFFTGIANAANTDTLTINYEVTEINEISIDGASVTLTISTAVAGSEPTQVSASTTYDITTNCATDAKKITAAIDTDMPSGLTLSMEVDAPNGGTSAGTVTVTTTSADVVTGIDSVAESNIDMTLYLDATISAGVISASTRTLTLTLTDTI